MATQKQILAKRKRLEKRMSELSAMLISLQKECDHSLAATTYRADTGNYDPSMNRYWTEHDCPSCGASWTTEQ